MDKNGDMEEHWTELCRDSVLNASALGSGVGPSSSRGHRKRGQMVQRARTKAALSPYVRLAVALPAGERSSLSLLQPQSCKL